MPCPRSCLCCRAARIAQSNSAPTHRRFTAGETPVLAGTEMPFVATLHSDGVLLRRTLPDGRSLVVQMPGREALLGNPSRTHAPWSVESIAGGYLCCLPNPLFRAAIEADAEFAMAVILRTRRELAAVRQMSAMLAGASAPEKVAALILRLSRDAPLTGGAPGMPGHVMADILGITQETVSREIRRFKARGIVARGENRRIKVLDVARLADIAWTDADGGVIW